MQKQFCSKSIEVAAPLLTVTDHTNNNCSRYCLRCYNENICPFEIQLCIIKIGVKWKKLNQSTSHINKLYSLKFNRFSKTKAAIMNYEYISRSQKNISVGYQTNTCHQGVLYYSGSYATEDVISIRNETSGI